VVVDLCEVVGAMRGAGGAIPQRRDGVRRYQTAGDLASALVRFGTAAAGATCDGRDGDDDTSGSGSSGDGDGDGDTEDGNIAVGVVSKEAERQAAIYLSEMQMQRQQQSQTGM
jgi:hypothetical protein